MAKRKKNSMAIVWGILALMLVLVLTIPLILNFDTLFGSPSEPDSSQNEDIDDNTGGNDNVGDEVGDNVLEPVVKVYFEDVELVRGEPVQSTNSNTVLTIDCKEEYEASFVALPGYKFWVYKIDNKKLGFKPNVDCLNTTISNGQASIQFPYDIMEWVLLQNQDVTQEQVSLPTDVNHNVPYVGLEVKVGEQSYLYPIQFDLNGVWTKVYLDKDEIVFCD